MFAGILEIAADAIITVDEAQLIMHFNKGAEQIFGYAPDEVIGKPLETLLPERFRAAHPALVRGFGEGLESARRMGHRREIYGLRKSGEEFPAEASISKLKLPTGRTVYSAVLRDVTDRKRAEQDQRFLAEASAILASSLDYEATLAAVPRLAIPRFGSWCALALVTADDKLERIVAPHADPALAETLDAVMTRYPLHWDSPWLAVDVLRTGTPTMVPEVTEDWLNAHTEDAEHERLLRLVGASSLLSIPMIARDQVLGAITIGRGAGSAPFDEGDLALATDLAARSALAIDNARLYRTAQRATQARDVVLGIVSHDLRNPLSAIAMCASALRENPPDAASERLSLADTIYESTEWMQRLIQDLLDVAAIEARQLSLERQPEPAEAIVHRALATFERPASERGLRLRVEQIAPAPPAVHGDAERILQVLANLVSNAVKFTEAGGEIVLAAVPRETEVEFSVRDTGAGIPADDLPHLFDLYWHARRNARSRGSGYGLAIAKGIVEAHGGRIWVESAIGVGSTFRFTVPAAGGA
jgi:PAS domain S-box-containing protein